jgi:hypothetical protein
VNGDVDKVLVITAGKGLGQRRVVIEQHRNRLDRRGVDTTPDTTSLFSLVAPVYLSDDTAGAVTALPSTTSNLGYLVKLDSSGCSLHRLHATARRDARARRSPARDAGAVAGSLSVWRAERRGRSHWPSRTHRSGGELVGLRSISWARRSTSAASRAIGTMCSRSSCATCRSRRHSRR